MTFRYLLAASLLSFLSCAAAAQSTALDNGADGGKNQTLTAPQQVRRIEPPSPAASAQDLEAEGDSLRAQKLYADAVDYYNAAAKRGGETSTLHNKAGIAYHGNRAAVNLAALHVVLVQVLIIVGIETAARYFVETNDVSLFD